MPGYEATVLDDDGTPIAEGEGRLAIKGPTGCRYLDDERQIRRWRQMTRHVAQVHKGCRQGDHDCRRRQRQALLHWAYDSRKL